MQKARQNILPETTRVKQPNKNNWIKLTRMFNYINATKKDIAHPSDMC